MQATARAVAQHSAAAPRMGHEILPSGQQFCKPMRGAADRPNQQVHQHRLFADFDFGDFET